MVVLEAVLMALFAVLAYSYRQSHLLSFAWDSSIARNLIQEGWPLLIAGLAVTLYMRLDMLMLQAMAGTREVGIYAAATNLSMAWYFVPMIVVPTVAPTIIKLRDLDRNRYLACLHTLYFFLAWSAVAIALPLSMLAAPVMTLLYGPEYGDGACVFALHMWAGVAVFLGVASSQYLVVERLQRISLYRTLIGLLCNFGLNLILIPRWGAIGAAAATVISYFLAVFSMVLFPSSRTHAISLVMALFRFPSIR
jgi:PST family polysaccharide transporter